MAELEKTNFYVEIAKILTILNFASMFLVFVTVLIYAFLQYAGVTFIQISESLFSAGGFWRAAMEKLFNLILLIPESLDTLFLAIIFLIIANTFTMAYKSKQGGWVGFFFFMSIGLPVWLFLSTKLVEIRNELIRYLTSTYTVTPTQIFFDYFTTHSIEISAFVFLVSLGIHMTDWDNVREQITKLRGPQVDETLEEKFEQ